MAPPPPVDPASELEPEPRTFIRYVHHPHSGITTPTIISLDTETADESRAPYAPIQSRKPWAPFRTRADFEYTETAVVGKLSKKNVNAQLYGMHHGWATTTTLTIHNYVEMESSLKAAREYVVKFQTGTIEGAFEGQTYTFEFWYREPWKWIVELVTDPSLSDAISWFPVRKYFHEDGASTRLYDEPNTANQWWSAQDELPYSEGLYHCFLPLVLWLDKGMITKRVRKHPILLRAGFLPSNIRNASGNGGGVLIGYMPIVEDPSDPADRNNARTLDFARFKRDVYHRVFSVILNSLHKPAVHGVALTCGDSIPRVLYPGIPITSLDGEEACSVSACRAALANYPCPRCLVHKADLGKITVSSTRRTTSTMRQVYRDAMDAPTSTQGEKILQNYGLHATENFFWSLPNSDPYAANSYDLLHSDDGGKWGKHIWPLVLDVLRERGFKGLFAQNMDNVPRWANLKHFSHVTTQDYADGQVFLDILKCILPCLVQLLPRNSPLIHCIRAYAKYRFMIGLHCMSEDRITRLWGYIKRYEYYCRLVTDLYDKNFDFYKQHAISHVIEDLHEKGTTNNYNTRPGEGFHQEVQDGWDQTNCKNTDPQLARIDENQEAIARIRMTVDNDDAAKVATDNTNSTLAPNSENELSGAFLNPNQHWSLGSPMPWSTSTAVQEAEGKSSNYRRFDQVLRKFLQRHVEYQIPSELAIQLQRHRSLTLKYQSLENWTEARDILRCNPDFHGRCRYDFVLLESGSSRLVVAHLIDIFTSRLQNGRQLDFAMVHMLKDSTWKPNTKWDGCCIYEEQKEPTFILVQDMLRGAHMIPTAITLTKKTLTYLNDLVDNDMFLRAGN